MCMGKKLCNYASDYLPGGLYWDAEPQTAAVLKDLEPSNDLCESILGLNDYLCTAIPNMIQITKSNLVKVKKIIQLNGSMNYLMINKSLLLS